MKLSNTLKLEEAAMFGLSIVLFNQTDFAWWWFLALILTPDIGMIGYAAGTKAGAFTYNLFHHKGVAILLLLLGWNFANDWLELAGIILFAHSSMDRVFGYGLKYPDSFHRTHLGSLKSTS